MTWEKNEEQPEARDGARFTPQHPETAITKADLNRMRSQQLQQDPERGPTNHTSNPSG